MHRIFNTVLLLILSNIFMTAAWYGHLRWFPRSSAKSLLVVIGIAWLIALPEYCLQVPANRYGHVENGGPFTAPQLKVIQEAVTLMVFAAFSVLFLKETPRVNEWIAFGLIFVAVVVAMSGKGRTSDTQEGAAPAQIETSADPAGR